MDTPQNSAPGQGLTVTPEEAGMRLLSFLERRLEHCPPKATLHRWVRTGQVRINKGRAQPFAALAAGDVVRIPPFAEVQQAGTGAAPSECGLPNFGPNLVVLEDNPQYLVLAKPAGLAAHGGTGITDSVAQRLKTAYAGQAFWPAPAHRLDRHVSGILLAGKTHAAQQQLSAWFAEAGAIKKEYLAWVLGAWPHAQPVLLEHWLKKESGPASLKKTGSPKSPDGREVTRAVAPGTPEAVFAQSRVELVRTLPAGRYAKLPACPLSLLRVELLTGRTHQIRVQLAEQGTPIIGDGRHGGPSFPRLLLHAFSLTLPTGQTFTLPPAWPEPFTPPET